MKRGGLCSDLHLVIETSRFILPRAGTPMECEVPDNMAGVVIIAIIIINIHHHDYRHHQQHQYHHYHHGS